LAECFAKGASCLGKRLLILWIYFAHGNIAVAHKLYFIFSNTADVAQQLIATLKAAGKNKASLIKNLLKRVNAFGKFKSFLEISQRLVNRSFISLIKSKSLSEN